MAKNNTQPKKAEEECKNECSSCATASSCSSAKKGQAGLPPKAAIDVKHVIMVLSGKGGVGKTTVAAAIATELARRGFKVHLSTTDPAAHVAAAAGQMEGLQVTRIDPRVETQAYVEQVMATAGKEFTLAADVQIYLDLLHAGLRGEEQAQELRRWPDFAGGRA